VVWAGLKAAAGRHSQNNPESTANIQEARSGKYQIVTFYDHA